MHWSSCLFVYQTRLLIQSSAGDSFATTSTAVRDSLGLTTKQNISLVRHHSPKGERYHLYVEVLCLLLPNPHCQQDRSYFRKEWILM